MKILKFNGQVGAKKKKKVQKGRGTMVRSKRELSLWQGGLLGRAACWGVFLCPSIKILCSDPRCIVPLSCSRAPHPFGPHHFLLQLVFGIWQCESKGHPLFGPHFFFYAKGVPWTRGGGQGERKCNLHFFAFFFSIWKFIN